MKILGIGNAIVDVICKVEEDFLSRNELTKSNINTNQSNLVIFLISLFCTENKKPNHFNTKFSNLLGM